MVVSSSFRSYSSGDGGSSTSKGGRRPTSVDREVRFSKNTHEYNGTSSAPHIGQIKIMRSSDEESGGSRGRYTKRAHPADSERSTVYNVSYGSSSKPHTSSLYRSSSVDRLSGAPVSVKHTPIIDPHKYHDALQPVPFSGGYSSEFNSNAYVPERTTTRHTYVPERSSSRSVYSTERTSTHNANAPERVTASVSRTPERSTTRKSYMSIASPMSYATFVKPVDLSPYSSYSKPVDISSYVYSSASKRPKRLPSPEISTSSYTVKSSTENGYTPHYGRYLNTNPDTGYTRVYSSSVPYRSSYSNESSYVPYRSRYQPEGTTKVSIEENNLYSPLPKYHSYATPVWENYDSKTKRSHAPYRYASNLDLSTQVELLKRSHSLPKLSPLPLHDTHSTFTHKGHPYHNFSGIISYRPVTDKVVEKHVHKSDAIDIEQKIKDIKRSAAIENARARRPSDLDDLFRWKPYEYKPQTTYDVTHCDVPLDSFTLKDNTTVPVFRYVNSTPSHVGSYPEVLTTTLPDGRRGLQYTTSSQTGYGNQSEANREIDNIVRKTKGLEDNLNALESFIAKNRHLFPEDILIYQFIKFYRLSPDELTTTGERPDAEQYGAKTVEKLVVPYGFNARDILRKYYPRHSDIEVEFDDVDRIKARGTAPPNIPEPLPNFTKTQPKRYTYETEEFDFKKPDRRRLNIEVDDFEYKKPSKRGDSVPAFYDSDLYVPKIKEASHRDLIIEARGGHARPESKYAVKREEDAPAKGGPAPEFTSKLRPRRVTPGSTVRLSCAISSVPEATVHWYKMDDPVHQDPRHHISYYHGLCSLEIHDVKPSDAGVYVVKATNPRGSTTCSAPLEIDGEEGPQFPGAPSLGKPIFISHLENVNADTGDRIIFKGVVLCKPVPDSVVWLKDGIEILENEKYRMYSDDEGNVKLSIRDVKANDVGLYTSIVKNNFGSTKSVASLKLRDVPDHSDRRVPEQPQRQEGSDKKPVFVVLPAASVKAYEGEPLTLKCVAQGEPKPKVRWFRGVREMSQSPRHNITSEKDGTNTFQINSIMMQTDGGTYEIEATNIFGTTTATVMVVVEPRRENEDFDFEPKKDIPFDITSQEPKEPAKPSKVDDSLEDLIEKITSSTDAPAPVPISEKPEDAQPVIEEIEVPKTACALGRDGSPSALKTLNDKEKGLARPADESKMNIPAPSTMEDMLADLKDAKPIEEEKVPEEVRPADEQKLKKEKSTDCDSALIPLLCVHG